MPYNIATLISNPDALHLLMASNDRRDRRWMVLFVVAAMFLVASRWHLLRQSAGLKEVAERKPAPDRTLPMLGGGVWKLSEHRGQVVMINYWATWCEPCREELSGIEQVARESAPNGLAVVGISMDTAPSAQTRAQKVQQYVDVYRVPYPIAFPDTKRNAEWGNISLPTTILIDRQGRVAKTYVGVVEREILAKDVVSLLAES